VNRPPGDSDDSVAPSGTFPRVVITSARTVALERVNLPGPRRLGPHEVVVRLTTSLISPGTELARYRGAVVRGSTLGHGEQSYPCYPGYAAVGVVTAAGPRCAHRPGVRVLVHAPHQAMVRVDTRQRLCVALPESLGDQAAPFARLAQVGAISLRLCHARPGDLVTVVGLGLVGNLAAQLAASVGYEVVGVDPSPARRAQAVECGLRCVSRPEELSADRPGAAAVLECSGRPEAVGAACALAAPRGEVFLVGAPWSGNGEMPASPILGAVFERFQTLRSGWEWQLPLYGAAPPGSIEACTLDALSRLADGRLRSGPLLTDVVGPHDAADAYHRLDTDPDHHLGVVIDWGQRQVADVPARS